MRETHQHILTVLGQIPEGKVATYGQVAELAGLPRRARLVGRVLSRLEDNTVPWHRVVNAQGRISPRPSGCQDYQRILLEEEGVVFDGAGKISLQRYQWRPGLNVFKGSEPFF